MDDVPASPVEENAAAVWELPCVLDMGERGRWLEILDQRHANLASLRTKTALHIYFHREREVEEGHPRRWFVLIGKDGKGDVCLAVTPPNTEVKEPNLIPMGVHVTGYFNKNPYPGFEAEIDALGEAIGIYIAPNYMGTPVNPGDGERIWTSKPSP